MGHTVAQGQGGSDGFCARDVPSVHRFKERTANEVRRNVVWACARDAQTLTDLQIAREGASALCARRYSVGTTVEGKDAGE